MSPIPHDTFITGACNGFAVCDVVTNGTTLISGIFLPIIQPTTLYEIFEIFLFAHSVKIALVSFKQTHGTSRRRRVLLLTVFNPNRCNFLERKSIFIKIIAQFRRTSFKIFRFFAMIFQKPLSINNIFRSNLTLNTFLLVNLEKLVVAVAIAIAPAPEKVCEALKIRFSLLSHFSR